MNLQVVDFDQALQVYDYRNCNVSKETVLKNILQTSKKTVIYVNNTDFAPGSVSIMPDVQVLAYGEQAEATAENIIYKELACTLRQQAVIDRADLLRSATDISEEALKVFEELDFIRDEHGKISFGSLQKNDLQNSPTFRGLQEEGRAAFASCQRNIQISPEEIIGLWQGNRFNK